MTAAQILAQLALPVSLLAACCWAIWAAIQTTTDRLCLGLAISLTGLNPDALDTVSEWRHFLHRLTLQDWRRLYPAALVRAAEQHGGA